MPDHLPSHHQHILFKKPADISIAIIGLGYVGLPLAVEFAKKYDVTGFDIKQQRIDELNNNFDRTLEVDSVSLSLVKKNKSDKGLFFTSAINDLKACNVYIISVPTPTDKHNRPDLSLIELASQTVGSVLKINDVVVYESTVYPGVTEEICVPILEAVSGLKFNAGFLPGIRPKELTPAIRCIPSPIF